VPTVNAGDISQSNTIDQFKFSKPAALCGRKKGGEEINK
jgi:hypothetical protein